MSSDTLPERTTPITSGEPAPVFTLTDQDRVEWSLRDHLASGDVVLCFYPLAFTGICGSEMKCISSEMARWQDQGAQVVGVSCDSFAAQHAWASQSGFTHPLLSDIHRTVCKAYGLYWPEMNVASRGTVIVTRSDAGDPVVRWAQAREVGDAMNFDEVLGKLA